MGKSNKSYLFLQALHPVHSKLVAATAKSVLLKKAPGATGRWGRPLAVPLPGGGSLSWRDFSLRALLLLIIFRIITRTELAAICLHTQHDNQGEESIILPSQDRPWEVTPERLSLHTLQKVGRAWEQAYQLCIPEKWSMLYWVDWWYKCITARSKVEQQNFFFSEDLHEAVRKGRNRTLFY